MIISKVGIGIVGVLGVLAIKFPSPAEVGKPLLEPKVPFLVKAPEPAQPMLGLPKVPQAAPTSLISSSAFEEIEDEDGMEEDEPSTSSEEASIQPKQKRQRTETQKPTSYKPIYTTYPGLGRCKFSDFSYRAKDRVGKGGFGQVFAAHHKLTRQRIALKIVKLEKLYHMLNEETIHKLLWHPNISRMMCTMSVGGSQDIAFAMQYVPGGNLATRLKTMHPLPSRMVAKHIAQLLLALRYVHRQCIAYRDVKAENMLIDSEENLVLTDFGLALFVCENGEREEDEKLSSIAGTLEYMAPEVAGGGPSGRAADYFSLGVLLHFAVTGSLPYHNRDFGGDRRKTRKAIAAGLEIPPTNNAAADELIQVLTTRDRVKRWALVYHGFETVKKMAFFKDVEWNRLERAERCLEQFPSLTSLNQIAHVPLNTATH